jgi:hypothetical protein
MDFSKVLIGCVHDLCEANAVAASLLATPKLDKGGCEAQAICRALLPATPKRRRRVKRQSLLSGVRGGGRPTI